MVVHCIFVLVLDGHWIAEVYSGKQKFITLTLRALVQLGVAPNGTHDLILGKRRVFLAYILGVEIVIALALTAHWSPILLDEEDAVVEFVGQLQLTHCNALFRGVLIEVLGVALGAYQLSLALLGVDAVLYLRKAHRVVRSRNSSLLADFAIVV